MGSILAIDYGLKRIGLAISDESRTFSFPCGVIENKNFSFVLGQIQKTIDEKNVELIVIGVPYYKIAEIRDEKTKKKYMEDIVMEFVNKLTDKLNISIETTDERFSSFMANENLKEAGISSKKSRKIIDAEAARLILQDYLERYKNN